MIDNQTGNTMPSIAGLFKMKCKVRCNLETLFYQILGLSLYSERGLQVCFPRRNKIISQFIGVTCLLCYLVPVNVLNLQPDTQLYMIHEMLNGEIDTMNTAALLSFLADMATAVIVYSNAILTQEHYVRIINRVTKIESQLPSEYTHNISEHLFGVLLGGSLALTLSTILLNTQDINLYWRNICAVTLVTCEICFFRVISTLYRIWIAIDLTEKYVLSQKGKYSKKFYYRQVQEIADLLDDFRKSTRLPLMVISLRILILNVVVIFPTFYLVSFDLFDVYFANFVWAYTTTVAVNAKFIFLGWYCEGAVDKFHNIQRSSEFMETRAQAFDSGRPTWETEGTKALLQCMHYSRMSLNSFGVFVVDRKFVCLVSGWSFILYFYCTSCKPETVECCTHATTVVDV